RFKKALQEESPAEYAAVVVMMPGITDEQLLAVSKEAHRKNVLASAEHQAFAEVQQLLESDFPEQSRVGGIDYGISSSFSRGASNVAETNRQSEMEQAARVFAKANIDMGDLAKEAEAKKSEVIST